MMCLRCLPNESYLGTAPSFTQLAFPFLIVSGHTPCTRLSMELMNGDESVQSEFDKWDLIIRSHPGETGVGGGGSKWRRCEWWRCEWWRCEWWTAKSRRCEWRRCEWRPASGGLRVAALRVAVAARGARRDLV